MSVAVLEEITLVSPLGVKFRDEATLAVVTHDLAVTLHPAGLPEVKTPGIVNRSGIFVFRNLPGMRDVERGAGDDAFWTAQPPRFDFVLEVSDRAGRFLPYAFELQLPVRRLLALPVASPLEARDGLPLFSAPSRETPEAMAVLRTELVDAAHGDPAAWALVEARTETAVVRGLADERGRLMLALPYPPPHIVLGSLPGSGGPEPRDQTWNVDLTVRYERRPVVPVRPDLEDILTKPTALTTSATLRSGQELLLAPIQLPAGSPS
jgi:hypothetical protein